MKALDRLDYLVGRYIYVPPIIRFCQVTKKSQHWVSNMAAYAATLLVFYNLFKDGFSENWGWVAVEVLLGLIVAACLIWQTITFGKDPEVRIGTSTPFIRKMGIVIILLDIVAWNILFFGTGEVLELRIGWLTWPTILLAEYARMIDRIPPAKAKGRKTKSKTVQQVARVRA